LEKSDPSSSAHFPRLLLLGGDGCYSGVPTYLEQLCAALTGQAGISIIADRNRGGYDFASATGVALREVEGMQTSLSPRRFWRALRALGRMLEENPPDLVWAHARMSLILLRILMITRRLRRKPSPRFAATYHGLPFSPGHRRGFAALSLWGERAFLALSPAHHLHFLSPAAAREFTRRVGPRVLVRHRCHVLTNCSHLGPITPHERTAHPTLLMTGRASFQKNHDTAIRLFAALPENYSLILCGAGTEPEQMTPRFEAARAGLSKRVRFLGPVPDIRPVLAEADLFLLTSRYEGMPIAALEAFEAGLPMALSDISGMAEILAAHPMATPIDLQTPEAAGSAITDLITRFRTIPSARANIQTAWAAQFSYANWVVGAQKMLSEMLE